MDKKKVCPDCEAADIGLDRRDFLRAVGVTAAAATASTLPLFATAAETKGSAAPSKTSVAETALKGLYESLNDTQKKEICFDWDFVDTERKRGLLRTFVSNNWQITKPHIRSDFYTKKQQMIIHDIWKGLINPDWEKKFRQQLKDDTGGKEWGDQQSIAIFGMPGSDKFEFVMTGRHMTLRADGNTESHVAFGGPIFYGHA
ncbi:MAG TPA: twin-arginine translocation signal domain-containing protein, partial [Gemmataceae bacterium]